MIHDCSSQQKQHSLPKHGAHAIRSQAVCGRSLFAKFNIDSMMGYPNASVYIEGVWSQGNDLSSPYMC